MRRSQDKELQDFIDRKVAAEVELKAMHFEEERTGLEPGTLGVIIFRSGDIGIALSNALMVISATDLQWLAAKAEDIADEMAD